jgi:hypothetical protein
VAEYIGDALSNIEKEITNMSLNNSESIENISFFE